MLKKFIMFLVVMTLLFAVFSQSVMAAPVQGKLKVEWYDLGPEEETTYAKIRELRDNKKLDTILEADFANKVKTSELSQVGQNSGEGLLMLKGDILKSIVPANIEGKKSDGEFPNTFGMVITGFITPKEDGKYKFRLWSDDSSRLNFNNEWICSTWNEPESDGRTWEQERISQEIELKAGQAYPIRVEYFEGWGGQTLEITWSKDGGNFVTIPTDVFSYDNSTGSSDPKPQEPSNTSDVSMLLPLMLAGAAAFGGFKLKKK